MIGKFACQRASRFKKFSGNFLRRLKLVLYFAGSRALKFVDSIFGEVRGRTEGLPQISQEQQRLAGLMQKFLMTRSITTRDRSIPPRSFFLPFRQFKRWQRRSSR
jgi:hypothetical protein